VGERIYYALKDVSEWKENGRENLSSNKEKEKNVCQENVNSEGGARSCIRSPAEYLECFATTKKRARSHGPELRLCEKGNITKILQLTTGESHLGNPTGQDDRKERTENRVGNVTWRVGYFVAINIFKGAAWGMPSR